uniref:Nhr-119 protein n=1 Tax=Pristionchus pacificus TaxID=54126 RepID=A0A8R1UBQ6_PRIPA
MPHHTSPSSSSNGLAQQHHHGSDPHMDACRVCGDVPAKMHYGVLACFGCKGFFRRTLKRPQEYTCRYNGRCIVDRHERNSCRFCRFKKCIEAGMDPKAVRPDRDATGRHLASRLQRRQRSTTSEGDPEVDTEWTRKLPVDMRTTLMQLMNIELMVTGGDAHGEPGTSVYPLTIHSLRAILEDPTVLDGKRTEMRYDGFVRVESVQQLIAVAHRGIIAAVDWVDHLFDLIDIHNVEDKMLLVKYGFSSLMVFSTACATAKARAARNQLNLANFGFVPADVGTAFEEPYHLGGRVVPRILDEVVGPLKMMHLRDEEAVLFKAIIMLNPQLRGLSQDGSEAVADLRDRIQETLYHVVRETHPKEVASSRFGNILLMLPSVMILGNMICENLSFVQSFGTMVDQLMADVLAEHEPNGDTVMMDNYEQEGMNHSESCSSLDSLDSNASNASRNSGGSSGRRGSVLVLPSNGGTPAPPAMTYNYSSPALSLAEMAASGSASSPMNNAASLPNLDQLQESSDPDYNLTLTPDMVFGMRQTAQLQAIAPQLQQQPQGDQQRPVQTPPNSPDRTTFDNRPTFYIESSRHKFAVTTTSFNGYPAAGMPMQQQQPMMMGQPPPQQQMLCKSNSLPQQYAPDLNGWGSPQAPNGSMNGGATPMDYDDAMNGYYR